MLKSVALLMIAASGAMPSFTIAAAFSMALISVFSAALLSARMLFSGEIQFLDISGGFNFAPARDNHHFVAPQFRGAVIKG